MVTSTRPPLRPTNCEPMDTIFYFICFSGVWCIYFNHSFWYSLLPSLNLSHPQSSLPRWLKYSPDLLHILEWHHLWWSQGWCLFSLPSRSCIHTMYVCGLEELSSFMNKNRHLIINVYVELYVKGYNAEASHGDILTDRPVSVLWQATNDYG